MAKTYFWTGAVNTNFGTAANWNDFTDGLYPSPTVPGTLDTVSFGLLTGGTISGTGTVDTLQFPLSYDPLTQMFIDADWFVTGTIDATGTNGILNSATVTIADGGLLEGQQYEDLGSASDLVLNPGATIDLTGWLTGYIPLAAIIDGNADINGGTFNASSGEVDISGQVTAEAGATASALITTVEAGGSLAGTLTVEGPATSWSNVASSVPIVENGGTYSTGGLGIVGAGAELIAKDSATVNQAYVGIGDGGSANISSGATVDGPFTDIYDGGSLTITDANTAWSDTASGNYLSFLLSGAGSTLTLSDDATLTDAGFAYIGDACAATVEAGGVWTVASGLSVGGTLTIETGGTVDVTGGAIAVGDYAGSSGIVYVDAGSTLEATGTSTPTIYELAIGANGSSTLNGTVTPAATDTIYVSGTGALLTTDGNPASVGSGGTGTLSVTGGATAIFGVTPDSSSANAALAVGNTGNGNVIVDGVGSSITADGDVFFAHAGTATLSVSNSGRFIAGDTLYGLNIGQGNNNGSGGSAVATVSSGGYVESLQTLAVGTGGDTGTLNISGGTVEAQAYIRVGATNTVDGVALGGTGFVDVEAGGTLLADGTGIGTGGTSAIGIGYGSGSNGSLTVSGTGALVSTSGYYLLAGANGGTGSITVSDGGSIFAGTPSISYAATALGTNAGTGSLTVTDEGSTYTADGQLNVGSTGTGHLLVENGGSVASGGNTLAPGYGLVIGWGSGGTSDVTVTGAGSNIVNVGHFIVGGSGNINALAGGVGSLLIEHGGLVRTSLPTGSYTTIAADIAADQGTGGSSATVTGAGSIWEVSGDLRVGDAAAGSLTISAGGVVTADTLEAGVQSGSAGVISVTGGSTLDISGAGTIGEAGSATLGIDATSTVNFSSLAIGTQGTVELDGSSVDWTSIANAGTLGGAGAITAAITNSGAIGAFSGTLAITGAITGTGTLSDSNGELMLNGSVGSGQTFDFIDAHSTLYLSDPLDFAGTIAGFGTGDTIVAVGANSETLIGDVMELFQNGNAFGTLDFASAPTNMHIDAAGDVTCFLAGTLIATERGERPVEDLAIGDLVLTHAGALRPIKWLGYRSFRAPFVDSGTDVVPVRIAAGALADGVPARDLIVSPLHAMLLDGALIPAGCLVNDASIRRCPDITDIDYIHIELDSHDIILAEGAPAETFVDCDSRMMFHNALDFARRYPNDTAPRWAFCAPRVESGFLLDHVRDRLAARAGLPPANPQGGRLLGYLEAVTPNGVRGWAFQPDHPGSRAVLEVVQGGGVVARVTADQFRPDLRDAGHGDGYGGFDLRLEHGFSLAALSGVRVRRASDGVPLSLAGGCFDQVQAPDDAQMAELLAAEAVPSLDAALGRLRAARWQRLSRPAGAPRVLMMDVVPPNPGHDAGSRAIVDHAAALLRLGYRVEFVATRQLDLPPSEALLALGVLCHGAPGVASVEDVLRHRAPDVIYLHRAEVATAYAAQAAALCPGARRIYALADLHHLRFARQARVEARPELAQRARAMQLAELFAISQVHAVITHSSAEAAVLARIAPGAEVHVVPWSAPVAARPPGFADRGGLAFVGGAAHAPNIDAVRWLTEAIMPAVWVRHPAMECLITGAGWPERLPRPDARIRVLGVVDDLAEVFDQVRLSVAPLRFGAGLKGKVLDSLAAGLPCVMTPIAAEGFALPPALRRLVAEDAAALAEAICRLHEDAAEHAAAARAGLQLVRRAFSPDAVDAALREAVTGARFRLRAAG